jgi:hypothetical protein
MLMTRRFEALYKVSSTGKITKWSIETHNNQYTITTGYTDGAIQSFSTNVNEMKNSKSLEEQTEKMAESQWNLKRKVMYPSMEEARIAFTNKSMALAC